MYCGEGGPSAVGHRKRIRIMEQKRVAKRVLGSSGIEVSAIGLGCMSLSGTYGACDDDAGIAIIHAALDQGISFLDSSDMYGWGHNEELIGRAIKGRRSQAVLATKFGNLGGRDGKFADGRPEYVAQACEASLKRLGIEAIDLYFQHRIDPSVPVEETIGAMALLVKHGKVRALGLSEARPETIRRAHKVHPIAAVENEFSLLYRSEAEETRRTTAELDIAFVAYSPLGRGLLTAKVEDPAGLPETDTRRRHPRFAPGNLTHNMELVSRIEVVAKERGCAVGQLALAWLLAQGADVIPIPGTKRKERLWENIEALSISLTDHDLAQIAAAIPAAAAAGERYPATQMKSVYL
jgi:aryl-alcohol dehydrogenase-like predicted oxidoreductase